MFPDIYQSLRDGRAHFRISHHDIRTYFSDTAGAEPTMNARSNAPTAMTTITVRTNSRLLAVQQRLQHANTQLASYDFKRHPPLLSWAQHRHLSLTDLA
jgi:hypothetical protein